MKSLKNQNKKPTLLVILDGFGYGQHNEYNAIACADTPFLDFALQTYPHILLNASGKAVGLPPGYIGNSEVGHMTIGTGKIIKQPMTIINEQIEDGSFYSNTLLIKHFNNLAQSKKKLHLAGILSDAGVHGHINHLCAYIELALRCKVNKIIVHAFLDGRDVGPQTAHTYLTQLQAIIEANAPHVELGTLHGRFYAMDRDHNWERTHKSYAVMTQEQTITFASWQEVITHYYAKHIFDEFIPPTQLLQAAVIENGDGLIFYDTRPERERQLAEAFANKQFAHFPIKKINLSFFITPVPYGNNIKTITLLPQATITNTLKEQLIKHNKTIFTIAETEKYAHVTYFFDGGNENIYPLEKRVLIPSIKTKSYADYPCMSAQEITHTILSSLQPDPFDFYVVNYANADMVGHTGNFNATVKAIECLDKELKKLYEQVVLHMNGTLYITADHGKAEDMFDATIGQPRTAHTANPVPFIMIQKQLSPTTPLPLTQLSDICDWIISHLN
ncbi:MAG: 2,3-bisphosphoglycerate-independent phosphoglycerate mutase [Candidatus Dependentiae bacterium]